MKSALWAAAAALSILVGVSAGTCLAGCKGGLDPKKAAVDLVKHQAMLDGCKAVARDAGSVAAFDACVDAGAK